MKKKFLLVMMALASVVSTQAFTYDDEDDVSGPVDRRTMVLKVGPKAGVNFSTMSKFDEVDLGQGMGVGFELGAAAQLHFGRKRGADAGTGPLALQVEALYVNHSIKTDVENIKLNYFEVPILLKYFITPNFNIEVGPTIAGTLSTGPDYLVGSNYSIATGDIKGFDIKATIGVSYELKKGLFASARYNLGTSDLAGNFPCKVSAVSVSVGWLFDVAKF